MVPARHAECEDVGERHMQNVYLDQIIPILDMEADMTLATVRSDGYPQTSIVSYVNDGLTLYFGTSEESQKAKNIDYSEKVSLSINRPRRDWLEIENVSLGGVATIIKDPSEHHKVRSLLFSKYPEIAAYAPSTDSEAVLYRIDPVVVTLLDYTRGFGFSKTIEV
jgi:nitroimidazol reductase NimA-like FMN-containing flavoprotein (pyridoxamine 5'-phosphate oxidase superfamily)